MGHNQHQTPLILTGGVQAGPPNLESFLTGTGSPFDFVPNIIYESGQFLQTLLEESLKLFPAWECGFIVFDPIFMLLPAKKDPILEEKGYKRYAFMVLSSSRFKMVLALLTKVVALHVEISII